MEVQGNIGHDVNIYVKISHKYHIISAGVIMSPSRNNTGEEPTSEAGLSLDQRERQEKIRERVITNGFVRSELLAEEFSVTLMTIHRDLDVLQRQGWLRKIRGGATAQPSALFHGDIRYRMQAMKEA